MFEKVTSYYGSRVARALGGTQKYLQNENNWNMPHHQNHIVKWWENPKEGMRPFPISHPMATANSSGKLFPPPTHHKAPTLISIVHASWHPRVTNIHLANEHILPNEYSD